ncbi:MAG: hypothetical protein QM532_02790, partial [Cyanobium sp. MAG06]|nr:hypothetical protein [Cyanobium sp. MAG06]
FYKTPNTLSKSFINSNLLRLFNSLSFNKVQTTDNPAEILKSLLICLIKVSLYIFIFSTSNS